MAKLRRTIEREARLGDPEWIKELMLQVMRQARSPPQFIHAFERTGHIGQAPMEEWPSELQKQWHHAIAGYLASAAECRKQ